MQGLIVPRSEIVPVYRDDVSRREGPVVSGHLVKHWDGRVDACAYAEPAHLRLSVDPSARIPADDLIGLSPRQRELLERGVSGGAFAAASGWYAANMLDVFDASQTAFAYLADTVKIALFTNSIGAMSYYTDTSFGSAPYTSNEASGTGYSAGGYTLANKTCTQSPNGTVMFDNTVDPNWSITGSFAAGVRGGVVYDTTLTNWLVLAVTFGADYNVTNGTFTVQLAAAGLATILFAA